MPYVNVKPMECQSEPSYTLSAQLDLYLQRQGRNKPNKMMVKDMVKDMVNSSVPRGTKKITHAIIHGVNLKLQAEI